MPFVKGQSGNPGGRRKGNESIRALARVDSHRAYAALARGLDDEDPAERRASAVQILKIAGVSFQSEAEEKKTIATTPPVAAAETPALESFVGSPELPLN